MDFAELIAWLQPAWHRDAECRDRPDVDWFPESFTFKPKEACAICARCRVRSACLDAALDLRPFDDFDGVWGGTTPGQREHLRRARAAQAA